MVRFEETSDFSVNGSVLLLKLFFSVRKLLKNSTTPVPVLEFFTWIAKFSC